MDPAHWRGNHAGPAEKSPSERDLDMVNKLLRSGKVHPDELFAYITPVGLLGQGGNIDPVNVAILVIINNMARTRRMLLDMKLQKKQNSAAVKAMEYDLLVAPVEIQEHQGEVKQLKGRYVRIPAVLVSYVRLVS